MRRLLTEVTCRGRPARVRLLSCFARCDRHGREHGQELPAAWTSQGQLSHQLLMQLGVEPLGGWRAGSKPSERLERNMQSKALREPCRNMPSAEPCSPFACAAQMPSTQPLYPFAVLSLHPSLHHSFCLSPPFRTERQTLITASFFLIHKRSVASHESPSRHSRRRWPTAAMRGHLFCYVWTSTFTSVRPRPQLRTWTLVTHPWQPRPYEPAAKLARRPNAHEQGPRQGPVPNEGRRDWSRSPLQPKTPSSDHKRSTA